jgi:hypothetical protein
MGTDGSSNTTVVAGPRATAAPSPVPMPRTQTTSGWSSVAIVALLDPWSALERRSSPPHRISLGLTRVGEGRRKRGPACCSRTASSGCSSTRICGCSHRPRANAAACFPAVALLAIPRQHPDIGSRQPVALHDWEASFSSSVPDNNVTAEFRVTSPLTRNDQEAATDGCTLLRRRGVVSQSATEEQSSDVHRAQARRATRCRHNQHDTEMNNGRNQ